jgi:hypothetical protein
LAAYVVNRTTQLAERARRLVLLAGTGGVLDNLTDATVDLFGRSALTISSLVMSRPEVAQLLYHKRSAEPVLHDIQLGYAEYLDAEVRLGRIAAGTDTATLSFTLFASAHQLFLGQPDHPIRHDRLQQVIRSLLAGVTTAD